MKFDELDKRMRIYETSHDFCILPNIYMVARIDGRGFTSLTKKKHDFQRSFDETFRLYGRNSKAPHELWFQYYLWIYRKR